MQKVYISGTNQDTDIFRDIARNSILQMGMYPILFEAVSASGRPVLEVMKEKIKEADVFVGIYVYRYGRIPDGHEKSYTHIEYEWAKERGIPCLLFIFDVPLDNIPNEFAEPGKQEKLTAFTQKMLSENVVSYFLSPEDFQAKLFLALANIKPRFQTAINIGEGTRIDGDIIVVNLDEDTIEQIVNRTLEIYDARRRVDVEKHTVHENDPNVICVEPVFGQPRKDQQYYCQVFVIMPFDPKFKPVYDLVMKRACEELSLDVKRGDDFFAPHNIMDEIWTAIYRSDIVIVDCTHNKPNVFYELGIAHVLGKPAILITQTPNDMPFDIKSRRFIPYEDTGAGFEKLRNELKDAIIKIMNKQP